MNLTITPQTHRGGEIFPGRIVFNGPAGSDETVRKHFAILMADYRIKIRRTPELNEFQTVEARLQKYESELVEAKSKIETLKSEIRSAAVAGENDTKLQLELSKTTSSIPGLESRLDGLRSVLAEKRSLAYEACLETAKLHGPAIEKEIKTAKASALQKAHEALQGILQAHLARIDTVSSYDNLELSCRSGCQKIIESMGIRSNK